MKDAKSPGFEAHLFICTHSRDAAGPGGPKESCAARGAVALRDRLKDKVKTDHPEWKGRVRVNASGCLDRCSQGVAAVLYPENRWFENLNADDGTGLACLERALEATLGKHR